VSFLRELQCSPADLSAATHFEAVCRSTIAQTRADSKATMAAYHSDTLHATASRWSVRLPQKIYLSKPVAGTAISHVDDWTGEYVLSPTNLAFAGEQLDVLVLASLCGWAVRAIDPGVRGAALERPEPADR